MASGRTSRTRASGILASTGSRFASAVGKLTCGMIAGGLGGASAPRGIEVFDANLVLFDVFWH